MENTPSLNRYRLDFQPFEGIRFHPPPACEGTRAHKTAGERAYNRLIERKKTELVSCLILSYCLSSCLLAIHLPNYRFAFPFDLSGSLREEISCS